MYKLFVKRMADVLLSGLALLVLCPIIGIIALLVLIFLGRPIIFKQERTGKDNKSFYIFKFKTMKDTRDEEGKLLPDEKRRCRFGDLLRSTSLDELPELWNIFSGDMSIIGPRPLRPSYLAFYKENEKDRNKVRGGLVPPEVMLPNIEPSWDEQLGIEGEYARTVSFKTDLKVFFGVFANLYRRMVKKYGEYAREPLSVERAYMIKETETVNANGKENVNA